MITSKTPEINQHEARNTAARAVLEGRTVHEVAQGQPKALIDAVQAESC